MTFGVETMFSALFTFIFAGWTLRRILFCGFDPKRALQTVVFLFPLSSPISDVFLFLYLLVFFFLIGLGVYTFAMHFVNTIFRLLFCVVGLVLVGRDLVVSLVLIGVLIS